MEDPHDILGSTMSWLFRLRGVLDPAQAVPGLGASLSEALALGQLAAGELTQQDDERAAVTVALGALGRAMSQEFGRDPGLRTPT